MSVSRRGDIPRRMGLERAQSKRSGLSVGEATLARTAKRARVHDS